MMILASPKYFGESLPRTQVHHGRDDKVVPIIQSESLASFMLFKGIFPPDFEYFMYEGGTHDKNSLPGSQARVEIFLNWVLQLKD